MSKTSVITFSDYLAQVAEDTIKQMNECRENRCFLW